MGVPLKLYISCWSLGAAVQSVEFFCFCAVDYFNFFFPADYKPELYVGLVVGLGATAGSIVAVIFQQKENHLTIVFTNLTVSAILLVVVVVITPMTRAFSVQVRFGVVLTVIFVAETIQNAGGGVFFSFVGKHFPSFGVQAAQSGGLCVFVMIFIVRCASKGAFESMRNKDLRFQLSGHMFAILVDGLILLSCCLIAVLRTHVHNKVEYHRNRHTQEGGTSESTSLLRSDESGAPAPRGDVMRNNMAALASVFLTMVISNTLVPGIASLIHADHNCHSFAGATNVSDYAPTRYEDTTTTEETSTTEVLSSDSTGWFIVILFGCYSVAAAVGANLPMLGMIYSRSTVILNPLIQLFFAIPILLIYFKPCVSWLQADWLAYLSTSLLGLVAGYGQCTSLMLLAPGERGKKNEEGQATSMGFMFQEIGTQVGTGVSVFLSDYVYKVINN